MTLPLLDPFERQRIYNRLVSLSKFRLQLLDTLRSVPIEETVVTNSIRTSLADSVKNLELEIELEKEKIKTQGNFSNNNLGNARS